MRNDNHPRVPRPSDCGNAETYLLHRRVVGSKIAKHFRPRARASTLNISDHLSYEIAMNVRRWNGDGKVFKKPMVINEAAIWMDRCMVNPPSEVLEMSVR